jgi:hypothetical protein
MHSFEPVIQLVILSSLFRFEVLDAPKGITLGLLVIVRIAVADSLLSYAQGTAYAGSYTRGHVVREGESYHRKTTPKQVCRGRVTICHRVVQRQVGDVSPVDMLMLRRFRRHYYATWVHSVGLSLSL